MKIIHWLKKIFCKKKLFKEAAYHEAGHIAFTYLYGYSCGYTELDIDNPGDGRTEFVFGKNRVAVNTILNQLNGLFSSLTAGQQQNVIRQAHWLSMIFCAGASTEAYFFKPASSEYYDPILKGPDLEVVDAINNILGQIHTNPTQETLRKSLCMIENFEGLRTTIDDIAKAILNSPNKRLDQQQIQQILTETNFNNTINEIIQNAGNIC